MDHWTSFWKSQGAASQGHPPQVQVLRTLAGQPVSPEAFAATMASVMTLLQPGDSQALLDLCCGNGVVTRGLFERFQTVVAVDIAAEFISLVRDHAPAHVTARVGDAKLIEFPESSFDRILLYAGLQYFSESEAVALFARLRRWLRPRGRVLVGDIPDLSRRWIFFDSVEREDAYFSSLKNGQPVVGFWYESGWLIKLARHAGFSAAERHDQAKPLPYHHYRFDLVLKA
jgi:ubiquinone/menaquinone biosynthesis C-methylase UbiE